MPACPPPSAREAHAHGSAVTAPGCGACRHTEPEPWWPPRTPCHSGSGGRAGPRPPGPQAPREELGAQPRGPAAWLPGPEHAGHELGARDGEGAHRGCALTVAPAPRPGPRHCTAESLPRVTATVTITNESLPPTGLVGATCQALEDGHSGGGPGARPRASRVTPEPAEGPERGQGCHRRFPGPRPGARHRRGVVACCEGPVGVGGDFLTP